MELSAPAGRGAFAVRDRRRGWTLCALARLRRPISERTRTHTMFDPRLQYTQSHVRQRELAEQAARDRLAASQRAQARLRPAPDRGERPQRAVGRRMSAGGAGERAHPEEEPMHGKAATRRQRVSRTLARVLAGWRTGLPGPVLVLQAGTAVNYFGTGLILPFEILYLHQARGFPTATAGLVLAAVMGT